jgi:hypothetical protein
MPYRWAGSSQRPGHGAQGPAAASSSGSFNVISTSEPGYQYLEPAGGASTSTTRFDDKLLPPGAGTRPAQLNEAARDREELDRAVHASKEQAEVRAASRAACEH